MSIFRRPPRDQSDSAVAVLPWTCSRGHENRQTQQVCATCAERRGAGAALHEHEPTAMAVRGASTTTLGEVQDRLGVIERTLGELLHRNSGAAFTSELPPVNVILPAPLVCPVCKGTAGEHVVEVVHERVPRAGAVFGDDELVDVETDSRYETVTREVSGFKTCGPCLGTGVARPAKQEVVLRMVRA